MDESNEVNINYVVHNCNKCDNIASNVLYSMLDFNCNRNITGEYPVYAACSEAILRMPMMREHRLYKLIYC